MVVRLLLRPALATWNRDGSIVQNRADWNFPGTSRTETYVTQERVESRTSTAPGHELQVWIG